MTKKFLALTLIALGISLIPASQPKAYALSGRILISEIKLGGGSEPKEFVEIYNDTGSSFDLGQLTLEYAKPGFNTEHCGGPDWKSLASPSSLVNAKQLSGTLAAGQFHTVEINMNDDTSGALHLVVAEPYVVHDAKGWGPDKPCYTNMVTPVPANGKSLQRPFTADNVPVTNAVPSFEEFILVDMPTPGATNCLPTGCSEVEQDNNQEESEDTTSVLEPCPEGKFRNPETNRCKNIEQPATSEPCGPGQERNPATNRCRNIATGTTLTPCDTGEERNPETNRCRKVTTTSTTLPSCQEGYERNPETNRCRKITDVKGASAISQKENDSPARLNYLIIGGVSSVVFAYGIYEYRKDIATVWGRLAKRFSRGTK